MNEKYKEANTALQTKSDELTGTRLRLKQAESSLETLEVNYKQAMKKLSELVRIKNEKFKLICVKDEDKMKEKMTQLDEKEKQFQKAIAKIDHAQVKNIFPLKSNI